MLEARDLVQACVSKGEQSGGFRDFCGLRGDSPSRPDGGYQLYLESLCDELSVEVKVLFDRRDPASLLWPRRQALTDLLALLRRPRTGLGLDRGRDDWLGVPVFQQPGGAAADA